MTALTYIQFHELARIPWDASETLVQKMAEWNHFVKTEFTKLNGTFLGETKGHETKGHETKGHETKSDSDQTSFKRTTSLTQISSSSKDINLIRIQINKLTPGAHFQESSTQCISRIKTIINYYKNRVNGSEIINEIASVLYTACVSSNLFSEMYADFFVASIPELTELSLVEYLLKKQEEYFVEFMTMIDISPDEYDAFCRMTKQNDVRKYTSLFYTHLFKRGVFSNEYMVAFIYRLLYQLELISQTEIVEQNQIVRMECIVDNVSILIMFTQSRLSRMDIWFDKVVPYLYKLSPNQNDRLVFAWKRLLDTVDA